MSKVPKIRRWFRFSLRTLLIAMLVLAQASVGLPPS